MNVRVVDAGGVIAQYDHVTDDIDRIGTLRIFDAATGRLIAAYSPTGWFLGTYTDNQPADAPVTG